MPSQPRPAEDPGLPDGLPKRLGARRRMTVAEVLELPAMRRGSPQILAGEDHLDREVRWAHTFDMANVADLLKGGELVLSTGSPLGSDTRAQRWFIEQLSEQGAAALAVALGGAYKTALPDTLVTAARSAGLPLIVLRRRVRFVDITEAVHQELVDREAAVLRRGGPIHERLDDVMLRGGGIPEVLQELAVLVGNPVLLEDGAGEVVALATHRAEQDAVLDARSAASLSQDRDNVISVEVRLRDARWGHLTVLELDSTLDAVARFAAERAAVMVAVSLLREQHEHDVRARTRGVFLADLMRGRVREAEAERRARALGFDRGRRWLVPLAVAPRSPVAQPVDWAAMSPVLRRAAAHGGGPMLVGPVDDDVLIVAAVAAGETADEDAAGVAGVVRGALERQGLGADEATLALGPVEASWTRLGLRLRRVAVRARIALTEPPTPWSDARVARVDELLYALRDAPELAAFVEERLGPLIAYDRQRGRELLHTLEAYLDAGLSKTEAARMVHVERQSLYARLERIAEVLKIDLDDRDTIFALELAVRTRRLLRAIREAQRSRL